MIERRSQASTVTDLVTISDSDWHEACRRFNAVQSLAQHPVRLGPRVEQVAKVFGSNERTVKRWLALYRRNPDIAALLPHLRPVLAARLLRLRAQQLVTKPENA